MTKQQSDQPEHIPHVKDDQDSPYWSIRCSCRWKSGVCTQLDAAVEAYGEHMRAVGARG